MGLPSTPLLGRINWDELVLYPQFYRINWDELVLYQEEARMATKKKVVKKKAAKKKKAGKKIIKKTAAKKLIKKTARKPKKALARKKKALPKSKEIVLGKVIHYFPKVMAAVIKVKTPFKVGDKIKIKGHTTDFTQDVVSIQMDRATITAANKGQEIGLLVTSRVREADVVYKA